MNFQAQPVSRFVVLDSWRGICALAVAAFHLQALGHFYDVPIIRHAFLFVDFFFVLSGFVIAHAYSGAIHTGLDIRRFVIRRFGRVWPLHVAVLLMFVAAEALNLVLAYGIGLKTGRPAFDPEGYRPLATIPLQLLLLQAMHTANNLTWNYPSWSISAEFWTYLVFGAVCLWAGARSNLIMLGAGLAGATTIAIVSTHGIEVTHDFGFLRCLYGFSIGMLLNRLYRDIPGLPASMATVAEIVALVAVFAFVWFADRNALSFLAPIAFGIAVYVFSFEAGALSRMLRIRPLERLGQWSYSIYMVHAFVLALLWVAVTVLQRFVGVPLFVDLISDGVSDRAIGNVDPYLLDGLFVLYLGATIALAALTYQFIEMPGRQIFVRWSERLTGRTRSSNVEAVQKA